MTLIETGSLKADRIEYAGAAAAFAPFFFGHRQDLASEPRSAELTWQIEDVEKEQSERRAASDSTEGLACRRILHDNSQWTTVAHARRLVVEVAQSFCDHFQ